MSENSAQFFADNFAKNFNVSAENTLKSKKLKSLNKFKDEKGEDLIYVINYENGGFLLLSADQRVAPILAFSETSSFTTVEIDLPGGIKSWVQVVKEEIKRVKKENKEQSKEIKFLWEKYLSYANLKVIDPEDPCEDICITKGPFLQTTWDQGVGYNSLLKTAAELGCDTLTEGGRALTGCVAVAMAQVMKYHQHPSSYSWSSMYNNLGTTATATLMRDIGLPTAVYMNYTCDGSFAPMSNVVPALENVFNYSTSATFGNYNYNTVKTELDNNRPVILSSTDTYHDTEAHAWVCDGYQSRFYCDTGGTYLYFHMNWGWWSAECNGYYGFNMFDPIRTIYEYKEYLYSTDLRMVTGIKP